MRIDLVTHSQCTGCGACRCICPKSAVSMIPDNDWLSYPQINKTLCISCGKCAHVCPVVSPALKSDALKYYAAKHRDVMVHESSQSGGIFYALAKQCLKMNGKVFGAAFASDWSVRHICIDSISDLNKLQGSKYVQSELDETFLLVRNALDAGHKVLFSGTPCQCAGLKNFLNGHPGNLLTADLICHGVPAPKLWHDYLSYMKKKYHGEIDNAVFRVHDGSRRGHTECITINGTDRFSVMYGQLFYTHAFLRQSCLECQYRTFERTGDITIGDWVGGQRIDPDFFDRRGVSLVLLNTDAGLRAFSKINDEFILKKLDRSEASQPPLENVFHIPDECDKMRRVWHLKGFAAAARRYGHEPYRQVIKRRIKKLINL